MADLFNVTIHARDPRRLAEFWSGVLGYPVVQDDGGDLVRLAGPRTTGAPDLLILRVEQLASAGGRFHLDIAATDVDAEISRLLALGAQLADGEDESGRPRRRRAKGIQWVVLADPEGNELCLGHWP